jgi:hypothetical protein
MYGMVRFQLKWQTLRRYGASTHVRYGAGSSYMRDFFHHPSPINPMSLHLAVRVEVFRRIDR